LLVCRGGVPAAPLGALFTDVHGNVMRCLRLLPADECVIRDRLRSRCVWKAADEAPAMDAGWRDGTEPRGQRLPGACCRRRTSFPSILHPVTSFPSIKLLPMKEIKRLDLWKNEAGWVLAGPSCTHAGSPSSAFFSEQVLYKLCSSIRTLTLHERHPQRTQAKPLRELL
jgi:hypothetical protein